MGEKEIIRLSQGCKITEEENYSEKQRGKREKVLEKNIWFYKWKWVCRAILREKSFKRACDVTLFNDKHEQLLK